MVVSLNPVVTNSTTGVIAFGKSEHKQRAARIATTAFDSVEISSAKTAEKGIIQSAKRWGRNLAGGLALAATTLTGCGPNNGPLTPVEPDPTEKTFDIAKFEAADARGKLNMYAEQMGYVESSNLKSATDVKIMKNYDGRDGQYHEVIIDDVSKASGDTLTGREIMADSAGYPNGTNDLKIYESADKKRLVQSASSRGYNHGTTELKPVKTNGKYLFQEINRNTIAWILEPSPKDLLIKAASAISDQKFDIRILKP